MSAPGSLFDARALRALVTEFKAYIAAPSTWSNRRMSEYRYRFADFGIDRMLNASDLITQAEFMLETPDERRILIEITADDLDGGYVASVLGLPGCASQGDTVGEAIRNIAEAYEGVRDTLIALDKELPDA